MNTSKLKRGDITFNCVGFIDRRSEDLHARGASIEQKRFAFRVARNRKERGRIDRELREEQLPCLLRRQAG